MKTLLRFLAALLLSTSSLTAQDLQPVMPVQITGDDELYKADVKLDAGVKRLQTSATVTVQDLVNSSGTDAP